MKSNIARVCVIVAALIALVYVAGAQDLFDDKQRTEHLLRNEGLTPVEVTEHEVNSTFTATVNDDPGCTVSGMTDATDDAWMLAGFTPDWYPSEQYDYSDPGMPKWPPRGVTVAQVALEHPQICNIS